MQKYGLSFISDEDLFYHVKSTVGKYSFNIDLKKFNKNLIDPIKLTFDSKVYNKTMEELVESEVLRQMDKTNSNLIGYFHQNIFTFIGGKDWIVPKEGFDIINQKRKIFVEMKNKHNTMNSLSSQKTFMRMQSKLIEDKNNKCLLVEVIAKNSQDIPWKVSLDSIITSHENIRRVSIDKFYELVTGEKEAFKNLVEILPLVIEDVVESISNRSINNTVFEELKGLDENIIKSLYLLSFQKYEGFNTLNLKG